MNKVLQLKPELQNSNTAATVLEAILSRQSISPKRMVSPGPNPTQIMQLMAAAAAAPDHGKLKPWRFIEFPLTRRAALAEVFATALCERLPNADDEALERAREKASRAPVLLGLVLRLNSNSDVPHIDDQMASGGAAMQNVLLAIHAMGFGARALSGQAVRTKSFRTALKLADDEIFLCFIAIGTPACTAKSRLRAQPETLLSRWDGISG